MIKTGRIIIMSLILIALFAGLNFLTCKKNRNVEKKVIITGLNKGKGEYFSKELTNAFNEFSLIEKGNNLLREGRTNEAIKQFKYVIGYVKDPSVKIVAEKYLVSAYEKNRDYIKAYKLMENIIKNYEIPSTDKFRIPDEERLNYLRYAAQGNYDLAVKHAQLAAEADSKLPNRKQKPREDYIERLNDLIAAKDYILSLKNKQN